MNSQKSSNGASLGEEKAYLICPERINHPEMGLERLIELSTMSDGSTTRVRMSIEQRRRSQVARTSVLIIQELFINTRPEPTGFGDSLTNASDVCSSL